MNGLFSAEKPENIRLEGISGAGFVVVGIRRRRGIVVVDLPRNLLQQGLTLHFLVFVMLRHVSEIADQWKRLEGIRNSPFFTECGM